MKAETLTHLTHVGTFRTKTQGGAIVRIDMAPYNVIGEDLDKEMSEQPGIFANVMSCMEEAKSKVRLANYNVYCAQEDIGAEIREKFKKEKLTETALRSAINRDPRMREAYEKQNMAKAKYGKLSGIVASLEQRCSMLQSMGANRRKEWNQSEVETRKSKR